MNHLFEVSADLCVRCGACRAVCPAQIIEQLGDVSIPVPVQDAEMACIRCGHCVAVCPVGALTHRSMTPAQCPPVRSEWHLSPQQAEHFLRFRRSTRVYTGKRAERDLLQRLIAMASHAPTGHNSQSVCWHVVYDSGEVRALAEIVIDWMRHTIREQPEVAQGLNLARVVAAWEKGIDRVCRSAPHLVLAHGRKNDRFVANSSPIALSYLELAAPAFGLGTCWAGYFTAAARSWYPLQEALGLPDGHVVFGGVLAGYPMYSYHRLPLRNTPRITWQTGVALESARDKER